jgi:hypothetical protein
MLDPVLRVSGLWRIVTVVGPKAENRPVFSKQLRAMRGAKKSHAWMAVDPFTATIP